jgi:hypothetical protein
LAAAKCLEGKGMNKFEKGIREFPEKHIPVFLIGNS